MKSGLISATGRRGRLRFAAAFGTAVIVAAGAVACGGDSKKAATPSATAPAPTAVPTKESGDVQALRQVFLTAVDRWNARDLDGFMTLFTDRGLISSFGEDGQSIDETKAGLKEFFASQPIKNLKFSQENISGDVGAMDVVFALGPALLHSRFTLARAGATWKLDGEESDLPVDVPAGATTINMDLIEFAFGIDPAAIAAVKGQFALVANNLGKQGHEVAIARIPDGVPASDIVQGFATSDSEGVPGVEFITGIGVEPGETSNLVFSEPLAAGRYLFICFRPDTSEAPDGTPHALKGMYKEFTIQ
jgi:hypothetical protein